MLFFTYVMLHGCESRLTRALLPCSIRVTKEWWCEVCFLNSNY